MRWRAGLAAVGAAMALAGCGGSVPGLSALNDFTAGGGVYGSARARASQARRPETRSPWDLDALRNAAPNPEFSSGRTETVGEKSILVRDVTFAAAPQPGTTLSVSGSLATLAAAAPDRSRLPALVLVGDRGDNVPLKERARAWAARGYAALAVRLPGMGAEGEKGQSAGPQWTDAALASPSPAANPLHASVTAVIAAVNLLSAQPEVDAHRIGLVGEGWSGVVAAVAGSLDRRLHALVVARAAGGLDRGALAAALQNLPPTDRDAWTKAYDPDSYAAADHPATLFVRPLAAPEPPLAALASTFHGWKGAKALALIPADVPDGETMTETAWLAACLLGETPIPQIRSVRAEGDGVVVTADGKLPLQSVAVYYASSDRSGAEWQRVAGQKAGAHDWRGALPQPAPGSSLTVFAALTDARGAIVCSEPGPLTATKAGARDQSMTARVAR